MSYLLRREEGPSITDGTPTSPRWSGLVGKAYWSLYVLRESRRQRKVPFLPRDTIEEIQRARLRAIIDHAYGTVPYYRSTMDELGLKPSDFQSVNDLTKLPLLTKEQVISNPERFVSTAIDTSRCVTLKSGGTTGLHTGILYEPRNILFLMACAVRSLEVVTRFLGKSLLQLRLATLTWPHAPINAFHRFCYMKTLVPLRRLSLSTLDNLEHNRSAINRFRPHVLIASGNSLSVLFQQILDRNVSMHLPKAIVIVGARLPEPVRALVEEELGIPVFSWYGAVEAYRIGFTCEERNGFHIDADLCHVAVNNEQGTRGEAVVSNLTNKAMVLLNYLLEDIVSLSDRSCPCGRSLPLIGELVGKLDEVIHLPDGRRVTPQDIRTVFFTRKDLLDYQVIQEEKEGFVVKVIPYKVSDFRQIEEDLRGAFGNLFGRTARVIVEPVDSIPALPNGKVKRICALGSPYLTPNTSFGQG